jgi:hypothetical protein
MDLFVSFQIVIHPICLSADYVESVTDLYVPLGQFKLNNKISNSYFSQAILNG